MTTGHYQELAREDAYTDSNMIVNFVIAVKGSEMSQAETKLKQKSNPGDSASSSILLNMIFPKLTPEENVSLDCSSFYLFLVSKSYFKLFQMVARIFEF